MLPSALIDTGAIIALLNRKEKYHSPCAEALEKLQLPLGTSVAVLTETFHLLAKHTSRLHTIFNLFREETITLLPITDEDTAFLESLMVKYADRPMDFTDATLVRLAERERLDTIFTIDHSDFETYRIDGRKKFRIVPERQ